MPAIPSHVRGGRFIGWGTALGEKVVTNDDLSRTMDTNDAWIRERTGIEHDGRQITAIHYNLFRRQLKLTELIAATFQERDTLKVWTDLVEAAAAGPEPEKDEAPSRRDLLPHWREELRKLAANVEPTPRPRNMKPSCEIVEYAQTRFMSYWAMPIVAARIAVRPPTQATVSRAWGWRSKSG